VVTNAAFAPSELSSRSSVAWLILLPFTIAA
jgi:hypothetical protein